MRMDKICNDILSDGPEQFVDFNYEVCKDEISDVYEDSLEEIELSNMPKAYNYPIRTNNFDSIDHMVHAEDEDIIDHDAVDKLLTEKEIEDMFSYADNKVMNASDAVLLDAADLNIEPPKLKDFSSICRMCLNRLKSNSKDKTVYEAQYHLELRSLIEEYTKLQISHISDDLPQKVCKDCINFLIEMHTFKSRCHRNDHMLRVIIQKNNEDMQKKMQDHVMYATNKVLPVTQMAESVENSEKRTTKFDELALELGRQKLGIFQCRDCPKAFSSRVDWLKHRGEAKHLNFKKPCPQCGVEVSKRTLKKHMLYAHAGRRSKRCEVCDADFATNTNLRRHMRVHTGEKPYGCEECDGRFTTNYNLQLHKQKHAQYGAILPRRKPAETSCSLCTMCNYCFLTNDILLQHLMNVHGAGGNGTLSREIMMAETDKWKRINKNRRWQEMQAKPFGTKRDVNIFKADEDINQLKPYTCLIDGCELKFSSLQALKRHRKEHAKSYFCGVCSQAFPFASNIRPHMAVHSSEKTFNCKDCNKSFKTLLGLTVHLNIHNDNRNFMCDECGMQFKQAGHLSFHMKKHVEHEYTCDVCSKTFAWRHNFDAHKRTHTGERPFKCRICDSTFTCPQNRKKHEKRHHTVVKSDDGQWW